MTRADEILQRARPFLTRPVVPPSHPLAGEPGVVVDRPLPSQPSVERIICAELRPIVVWHHDKQRVVTLEAKVACLPIGKDPEDWGAWVSGKYRRTERDHANKCWIVDLETGT